MLFDILNYCTEAEGYVKLWGVWRRCVFVCRGFYNILSLSVARFIG